MTYTDALRMLLHQLEECARSGEGAQLSPHSTEILLAALDAQREAARQSQGGTGRLFRIVVGNDQDEADKILARTPDITIARAMFGAAVKQHVGQRVRLCEGPRVVEETP